jgi:hypothetical protein
MHAHCFSRIEQADTDDKNLLRLDACQQKRWCSSVLLQTKSRMFSFDNKSEKLTECHSVAAALLLHSAAASLSFACVIKRAQSAAYANYSSAHCALKHAISRTAVHIKSALVLRLGKEKR